MVQSDPTPHLVHRLSQGGPRWKKGSKAPHHNHLGSLGERILQPLLAILGSILVILVLKSIFRVAKAVILLLEPPQKMKAKRGQNGHPEMISKILMVNEDNQGILVTMPSISEFDRNPLNPRVFKRGWSYMMMVGKSGGKLLRTTCNI